MISPYLTHPGSELISRPGFTGDIDVVEVLITMVQVSKCVSKVLYG